VNGLLKNFERVLAMDLNGEMDELNRSLVDDEMRQGRKFFIRVSLLKRGVSKCTF
jgi:hypothetical protein